MARDRRRFGSGGVVALTLHDTHLAAISRASPLALEYHAEHKARQARFKGLAHDFAKRQCALAAPVAAVVLENIGPHIQARKFSFELVCQASGKNAVDLIAAEVGEALDISLLDILGDNRFPYFLLGRWITVYLARQRLDCDIRLVAERFEKLGIATIKMIVNDMRDRMARDFPFRDMVVRMDRNVAEILTSVRGARS